MNKENTQKKSPLATQVDALMDFPEAMKEVIKGKRVHKLEWKDEKFYGHRKNEKLMLHKPDGDHPWLISDGDLLGEDYIVIEKEEGDGK